MIKDGPRIIAEVHVIGRTVCIRYLEFPHHTRGMGRITGSVGEMSVHSIDYPELGDEFVKIPGTQATYDELTSTRRLGSEQARSSRYQYLWSCHY